MFIPKSYTPFTAFGYKAVIPKRPVKYIQQNTNHIICYTNTYYIYIVNSKKYKLACVLHMFIIFFL